MRSLRIAFALALTLGSIWLAALAAPTSVTACSCRATGPEDIGDAAENPELVVFIGTVVAMDRVMNGQGGRQLGDMKIERVFKGELPPAVRVQGGGGGDCTIALAPGQRMITVAPFVDGILTPFLCAPYADPATAEGRAMVEAAERALGIGVFLEPPPDGPAIDTLPAPAAQAALPLVLATVAGVAAVLFGLIAWRARRGGQS